MSLLRVSVLSLSGITLWLLPPFVFSKRVPLHNFIQGIALVAGFACCFEARKGALKLAKDEEFEALKQAAVKADVVHEISTSVYVSEETRKNEAELLIATDKNRELLERALALSSENEEEVERKLAENADSELRERILQLQARGYGKAKIILEIWGASKGGSEKYKTAEAEYKRLMEE
ncbi:hypothetical protein [Microcoleus sp. B3-D7]|uniref:hypothetical protein n=1 Tax=Microcoleus sp. B3-D7 TaxID=2818659 RepID=UPI002FD71BE9